jgi:hypothetical protein
VLVAGAEIQIMLEVLFDLSGLVCTRSKWRLQPKDAAPTFDSLPTLADLVGAPLGESPP